MASNHTPAYGLNQWSLDDNFIMEDFNTDNRNIEQALLDAKSKFETGTYVGTGTYGAGNPNVLTFGFQPKLVIVIPQPVSIGAHQPLTNAESTSPLVAIQGAATFALSFDTGIYNSSDYNSALINLAWEGNTLRWYTNETVAATQYNSKDLTYRYLAIG